MGEEFLRLLLAMQSTNKSHQAISDKMREIGIVHENVNCAPSDNIL
jgi:hypothetical protein